MDSALIRARVLLARACGCGQVVPTADESAASWSARVCDAVGLPVEVLLPLTDPECSVESALEPWEQLWALDADEAEAVLAGHRDDHVTRRSTGTFYTADDVCLRVAADVITPLLTRPSTVAGAQPLTVLDPSCGTGAFLRAAAAMGGEPGSVVVHGTDIDPASVEQCRMLLALDARRRRGRDADAEIATLPERIVVGDALRAGALADTWPQIAAAGGFAAVVGNPPYVRVAAERAPSGLHTARAGNLSAWITEVACAALAPGGRLGLVLPVAVLGAGGYATVRDVLDDAMARVWASSFDAIPCTLFPGTVQRIAIVTAQARLTSGPSCAAATDTPASWAVTRFHRWRASERATLLDDMRWTSRPPWTIDGAVAKVGTDVEQRLLARVFAHAPAGRLFVPSRAASPDRPNNSRPNLLHYKRRWSYFLLFTDFMPPIWDASGALREPTEFKTLHIAPAVDARALIAAYSSSLFWWYFQVFSDNRNVNRRELAAFGFDAPTADVEADLVELADELMVALRASAEIRTCTYASIGTVHNTYFRQASTRPVLDRIDTVLARHYGMADDELAFVLGFEEQFRGTREPSDARGQVLLPRSQSSQPRLSAAAR